MEAGQQATAPTGSTVEGGHRSRGLILAVGLLAILAGVISIALPGLATLSAELFVGWLLIGLSAVLLVDAFTRRGFARIVFRILLALVTFAAGMYMVAAPLQGAFSLTVILVLWFAASGVAQMFTGVAEWKLPGASWLILSGVVSLVLGLMIANRLPEAALWAIGLLVGLQAIFYGMSAIATWAALGRQTSGTAS